MGTAGKGLESPPDPLNPSIGCRTKRCWLIAADDGGVGELPSRDSVSLEDSAIAIGMHRIESIFLQESFNHLKPSADTYSTYAANTFKFNHLLMVQFKSYISQACHSSKHEWLPFPCYR